MQSEHRFQSRTLLFAFLLFFPMILCQSTLAQTHSFSISKAMQGPGGADFVYPGDTITSTIRVRNFDTFGDDAVFMNVWDAVAHGPVTNVFPNLLNGPNPVQVVRVINDFPITLQTNFLNAPGQVILRNFFESSFPGGDYLVVTHTDIVTAADAQRGRIVNTAIAEGIDLFTMLPIFLLVEAAIEVRSRALGAVGDFVWKDDDMDGVQDPAEPGVSGVTVLLTDCAGNLVPVANSNPTITGPNGRYLFTGVPAGSYQVVFTLPGGYRFTTQGVGGNANLDSDANLITGRSDCFSLALGETNLSLDAGLVPVCNGSIGDFVWMDANCNGLQDPGEPGLPSQRVDLLNCANPPQLLQTTFTGADGAYSFVNLAPGNYRVRFYAPATFTFTTPDLFPDQANSDAQPPTGLTGCIDLGCNEVNATVDAGFVQLGEIGDFVWMDDGDGRQNGEPGFPDVQVELFSCTGQLVGSTTTDGTGFYLFSGLVPGSYRVRFHAPANYSFTTPNVGPDDVFDSDANAAGDTACIVLNVCGADRTVDAGLTTVTNPPACCPVRAFSDPEFNPNGTSHAAWLPGISTNLIFDPPGRFIENPDGTARLTGRLISLTNLDSGFEVDVTFSGRRSTPPAGSPKLDLDDEAYEDEGGPVDPDEWYYYTQFSGTLTGFGHYDGGILRITRTGPAFQLGVGANGKNVNFGGSGWFEWTVEQQPFIGRFPSRGQGDFNFDCPPCPPEAPRPAPAPRMLSYRTLPSGETELTIQGSIGRYYIVEGSEDLRMWKPIVTLSNTNNVLQFRELLPGSRCYYRLKLMP